MLSVNIDITLQHSEEACLTRLKIVFAIHRSISWIVVLCTVSCEH